MAAKKETKMPAESGMEEYFIVGSNFGGGGTLTAKGSKKVVYVCVCVCVCVHVCLLTMAPQALLQSRSAGWIGARSAKCLWRAQNFSCANMQTMVYPRRHRYIYLQSGRG
jgi:hypothetical protein